MAGRSSLFGLTAHERHQKLMHDYIQYYGGKLPEHTVTTKTDFEVLQENHRFIRDAEDDEESTWEVRLARRYYNLLFREYCIADLSRYKEGKVGLRWRTQDEVVSGKGQFVCGAKGCSEAKGLASYEVNFAYKEAGAQKQALVKVRVCATHALKLNYRKTKEGIRPAGKKRPRAESPASEGEKEGQLAEGGGAPGGGSGGAAGASPASLEEHPKGKAKAPDGKEETEEEELIREMML